MDALQNAHRHEGVTQNQLAATLAALRNNGDLCRMIIHNAHPSALAHYMGLPNTKIADGMRKTKRTRDILERRLFGLVNSLTTPETCASELEIYPLVIKQFENIVAWIGLAACLPSISEVWNKNDIDVLNSKFGNDSFAFAFRHRKSAIDNALLETNVQEITKEALLRIGSFVLHCWTQQRSSLRSNCLKYLIDVEKQPKNIPLSVDESLDKLIEDSIEYWIAIKERTGPLFSDGITTTGTTNAGAASPDAAQSSAASSGGGAATSDASATTEADASSSTASEQVSSAA
jgi:hypothetical protein